MILTKTQKEAMAKPSQQQQYPPAVLEIVQEIMSSVRSLPARPSIDEVDASMEVVKSVKDEELSKLEEVSKLEKPPDVPEELFTVLQEVKKNMVLLRAEEQRKEAVYVIDLDKRFLVFDELILRASRLVFGEEVEEKDVSLHLPMVSIAEKENMIYGESLLSQITEEAKAPKLLLHSSSEKARYNPGKNIKTFVFLLLFVQNNFILIEISHMILIQLILLTILSRDLSYFVV